MAGIIGIPGRLQSEQVAAFDRNPRPTSSEYAISTYVAGIPELVVPGQTGWLVPASDEAALAEAMREALTVPLQRLAAMGAAGRACIVEHHDALNEAKKLKSLFEVTGCPSN